MGNDTLVTALVHSMKRFGQLQPIIADEKGEVIDGVMRRDACQLAGIEPWIVIRDQLPPAARFQFLIRRSATPLEMAQLVTQIHASETTEGARRAPGTGKAKDVVAQRMKSEFAMGMSPREVAYALSLARATPEERAAVESLEPTSMRAAHRMLGNQRLGIDSTGPSTSNSRTELVKRAYEFKAAVSRNQQPLTDADRAVLSDLRAVIDQVLADGTAHAVA